MNRFQFCITIKAPWWHHFLSLSFAVGFFFCFFFIHLVSLVLRLTRFINNKSYNTRIYILLIEFSSFFSYFKFYFRFFVFKVWLIMSNWASTVYWRFIKKQIFFYLFLPAIYVDFKFIFFLLFHRIQKN